MNQQVRNIVFLAPVLAVLTAAATTHAGPCKAVGQECATTASCCRGLLCVNSNPPGKRPKGICLSPTTTSTTSTTTTSTTTTSSTTTTTLCVPLPPNCAGLCEQFVQNNCGTPVLCTADCPCQFSCFEETVQGVSASNCTECLAECFDECGSFCDVAEFAGGSCQGPN